MPIKKKEMDQMERMQQKILKQLQCLPNQAANTAVYTLIGVVLIRDRPKYAILVDEHNKKQ